MSVSSDPRATPAPRRLHQFLAKEVAMELTLADGEVLRRISPEEIKDGAWMDKSKKHELAPNVLGMVESFNRLALLVPTEVLEEKTPQTRAKVITAFIQIASKCYSLRNYNSLKAILAGLQCTPIFRLERTWKEVPSKRRKCFKELSAVVSEENNWAVYRAEVQRQLAVGCPCIPFLGAFLTNVVQQESYDKMKSKKPSDGNCESMYTILEAITVRHRLEKLTHNRSFDLPISSGSDNDEDSCLSENSSAACTPVLSRRINLGLASPDEIDVDGGTKGVELVTQNPAPPINSFSTVSPMENGHVQSVTKEVGSAFEGESTDMLNSPSELASLALSSSIPTTPLESTRNPPLKVAERRRLFCRDKSLSVEFLLDAIQGPDFVSPPMKHSSSLTSIGSLDSDDEFPFMTPAVIASDNYDSTQSLPLHLAPKKGYAIANDPTNAVGRRRRCTAHVPRLQVARVETCSIPPTDLLVKYQFMSLGCCVGGESKPAIRDVLAAKSSNPEAINYKLSYEREPE